MGKSSCIPPPTTVPPFFCLHCTCDHLPRTGVSVAEGRAHREPRLQTRGAQLWSTGPLLAILDSPPALELEIVALGRACDLAAPPPRMSTVGGKQEEVTLRLAPAWAFRGAACSCLFFLHLPREEHVPAAAGPRTMHAEPTCAHPPAAPESEKRKRCWGSANLFFKGPDSKQFRRLAASAFIEKNGHK